MKKKSLETIGYYEILDRWKDCAVTEAARKMIQNMEPLLVETQLRKEQQNTSECKQMIEMAGSPPLPSMDRILEYLEKAVRGEMLLPEQLEEYALFLNAVKRLKAYLKKGEDSQISIAFYQENLVMPEELLEKIGRSVRGGAVDDYASTYLRDLRRQITIQTEKVTEKTERALKANKAYLNDSFLVSRNGRMCLPVRRECKSMVSGSVVDQSSTGATLFMEPSQAVEAREELEWFRMEEEAEERRILYELTAAIADYETELREDIRVIEKLDFQFSKGKLSLEMEASEPKINTEHYIVLKEARHPMLEKEICVPLDFEIGNGTNGVIITGPNTGGKTVAIKTVALMSAMACTGLHIPCRFADITMQNQILCDIGDGQNITDNLSTFSAHIKNVLEILKRVGENSLVIMDELGSGTDPAEGMGIAIAILEELRKSKALFLVTTHYPEVKGYAEKCSDVINARMEFDRESLNPLYRLTVGEAGESCALYIAKRLGLPDHMLRRAAKEAYGAEAEATIHSLIDSHKQTKLVREHVPGIKKAEKVVKGNDPTGKFTVGDSVVVYPEKKIGIVVKPADEKGRVLIQVKKEKWMVSHKRLKLKAHAAELYPEDYDFSIIFDTVENRKKRHKMSKHHEEGMEIEISE